MPYQRKLGRPAKERKALLRNQVSHLLWHGRIETTLARAKEVRAIADHMVSLAVEEYDNQVMVEKRRNNEKGQLVTIQTRNDLPSKLHARRMMMSYLYDLQEIKGRDESKSEYKERTKDIRHPLIEKLFTEMGPKYKKRNLEKGCAGGYTRIMKMGPRRGDAAEMVIIEMV
ncbi:MAG: 50S ribosomal protein L17 [Oscillospiraceae bacterium]|jgi:large subunit ribosomal protein L17|nr:50S ribosomal protein L17 [Oscillospiraceae bacterium]